jgi:outer membrane protein TolC
LVLLPQAQARPQEVTIGSAKAAADLAVRNSQVWTIRRQKALLDMGAAALGIQDFLPSLGFSFSESDSPSLLAPDSRGKTLRLSVSQEIFSGGTKKLAYETGRLSALYGWQEFEGEYRNFLSTVMSLYYQYLLLRDMGDIRSGLVSQAGEQLGILKREAELGLSLETDYLEYAASYLELEQERDQSRRDLGALERQFKSALSLSQETPVRVLSSGQGAPEYFYFEPFLDYLWALVRTASVELKKLRLSAEYGKKQYRYGRRWYLPVIGAQGSISFSGTSYPLTEPNYSLQVTFDFSGLDFLSLRFTNGSLFERNQARQLSNGLSGDVRPLPSYPLSRKQGELNLLESALRETEGERELKERLYSLVISHDNRLRAAYNAEQRIGLMERRLEFSRLQLEKGELKRIDYLAELSSLAQTRISFADYLTQAMETERNLEIQTGFPFGGLADACRNL